MRLELRVSVVAYASLSHFFMKLVLAAPASGLPFLSTAFGSQAFFVHFVMKLFSAAPDAGCAWRMGDRPHRKAIIYGNGSSHLGEC
jgi:hypothetical protein